MTKRAAEGRGDGDRPGVVGAEVVGGVDARKIDAACWNGDAGRRRRGKVLLLWYPAPPAGGGVATSCPARGVRSSSTSSEMSHTVGVPRCGAGAGDEHDDDDGEAESSRCRKGLYVRRGERSGLAGRGRREGDRRRCEGPEEEEAEEKKEGEEEDVAMVGLPTVGIELARISGGAETRGLTWFVCCERRWLLEYGDRFRGRGRCCCRCCCCCCSPTLPLRTAGVRPADRRGGVLGRGWNIFGRSKSSPPSSPRSTGERVSTSSRTWAWRLLVMSEMVVSAARASAAAEGVAVVAGFEMPCGSITAVDTAAVITSGTGKRRGFGGAVFLSASS